MSYTNFKLVAEVLIKDHMSKIDSGEIELRVFNQHDYYVCESAIEALENHTDKVECIYNRLYSNINLSSLSAISVAHNIATIEIEPISSKWVD